MKERLKELQHVLERALREALPYEADGLWWLQQSGNLANVPWRDEFAHSSRGLLEPMHELIIRGGKRWRPLSMLLSAQSLNVSFDEALKLAVIIELTHNASLVIDDIEDASPLRRGEPAIHVIYGEDSAINSANFAYFYPLTLLDKISTDAETKLALYRTWHLGMRRVHMGQALDIAWHNSDILPTVDEYKLMAQLKTGALVAMGMQLLAILARQEPKQILAQEQLWLKIGLGFQILDDAFNLSHGIKGKSKADDLIEGKKSLPIILYAQSKPTEVRSLTEQLNRSRDDEDTAQALAMLLVDSGAAHQAYLQGQQLLTQALIELDQLLPESEDKQLLLEMIRDFELKMRA